jgi:type IV secretory pathway VirB3-like protein
MKIKNKYRIAIIATVVSHYLLIIAMVLSLIFLALSVEWYIAVPVITCVLRIVYSRDPCPLSMLECYFSRAGGFPEVSKFLKGWCTKNARQNWVNLLK